jgi:hypothetical protein
MTTTFPEALAKHFRVYALDMPGLGCFTGMSTAGAPQYPKPNPYRNSAPSRVSS